MGDVEIDQARLEAATATLLGAGLAFGRAGSGAPLGVDAGTASEAVRSVLADLSEAGARLTACASDLAEAARRCGAAYGEADAAIAQGLLP